MAVGQASVLHLIKTKKMKSHFNEIFEYTKASNSTCIQLLEKHGELVPLNTLKFFSHIFNAHHVWNARIIGEKQEMGIWDIHPLENLEALNTENYEKSLSIIENFDLEQVIAYTNSHGVDLENKVKEILFHLVNHATYHRGQLMAELREAGLEAVSTDYIFYKR